MKFKHYILAGVTALSFGMVVNTSTPDTALGSRYYQPFKNVRYSMPASWRGTYYNSYGDTMKVNKYSIYTNGQADYKSSWSGWRKLAFAKVSKKYYTLNAYATMGANSSRRWKMYRKGGNTYLYHIGAMNSRAKWKKYIKPKLVRGYYMADSTNFYYNTWRGAFVNYSANLYKTKKDAANEENEIKIVTNPRTKYYAKWLSKYQNEPYQDVIRIKYGSHYYYANNKDKDFIPYNTYYYNGGFISEFKPTQKSKIYLKNGRRVHTNDTWTWFHGKDDNYLTDYTYKNGKWHKGSTDYFSD